MTVEEVVTQAKEFIMIGGDKVLPITSIDNIQIGDGKIGPICKQIQNWYQSSEIHNEVDDSEVQQNVQLI